MLNRIWHRQDLRKKFHLHLPHLPIHKIEKKGDGAGTNRHSEAFDIDLVYLWVDGNDPEWQVKHNAIAGNVTNSEINCKGRFVSNDELKYSLRSVELYAPWIRNIFIVTDHQTPTWLNTAHPKIRMVDHTEILPTKSMPCFNATIIEHFLDRIPELAEHFIFANDDMLINKPVTPDTFFTPEGLPLIKFKRMNFRKWTHLFKDKVLHKPLSNYKQQIKNAAILVKKRFGIYYDGIAHHNMDAYLKSTYQHVNEMYKRELEPTFTNHMRSDNDIHRSIYSYVALAEKRGMQQYVSKKESFFLRIHRPKDYKGFEKYQPELFCMNDSQFATDDSRKTAGAFLSKLFPDKSSFEK